MPQAKQSSVGNDTVQFSDLHLVDQFPPPKINGVPAIYFSLTISREAIANGLVKAGVSREAADFNERVDNAHSYAQHLAAEYLNTDVAPGFRAYGDLHKYVVLDPAIVLPLLELADKSGLQVSEEKAGHYKNRQGLPRGALTKTLATFQALSDDLEAAIQLGVEEYAKHPDTVLAEAGNRFTMVPGNGQLFAARHRTRQVAVASART